MSCVRFSVCRFLRYGLAAVLLSITFTTQAYVPQDYKWAETDLPLSYRIDPDGAPGVQDGSDAIAIRSAFATWEAVACSNLAFEEQAWIEPAVVNRDMTNRVFWAKDQAKWNAVGGRPSTLALTFVFYSNADQRANDADIIMNGVDWNWSTATGMTGNQVADIETVVLHEIGHFFGLGHTNDVNAVMFPRNVASIRRLPAMDDIDGACALYSNGMSLAPVGAQCMGNADCASSVCVEDETDKYCSQQCTPSQANNCPPDFTCEGTSSGDFCRKNLTSDELCDQCNRTDQCNSGLCLSVPGFNNFRSFCTRACDPTPGP